MKSPFRMARDLMEKEITTVAASTPLRSLAGLLSKSGHNLFILVEQDGKLLGFVERGPAAELLARNPEDVRIGEIANKDFDVVAESTVLFELLSRLRSKPIQAFAVAAHEGPVAPHEVKGMISKGRITDSMTECIDLFGE